MKVLIYADPHLGKTLATNTTPASRERLTDRLYSTVDTLLDIPADATICAGDFFDKYSNSETVLARALPLATRTDVILSGNHDVTNAEGKLGSLEFLASLLPDKVTETVFGGINYVTDSTELTTFYLVPHHTTQTLFEEVLAQVEALAKASPMKNKVLITHCNYDCCYAADETSLNLSGQRAQRLLESFTHIFLGHDHTPKEDFGGRLVVIGSPHPTSFGDISDKSVILFDEESGSYSRICTWSAARYIEVTPATLDQADPLLHEFIRITGTIQPSGIRELTAAIKKLWAVQGSLFAVRSEVCVDAGKVQVGESAGAAGRAKLTDIIEAELNDSPELLALWREIQCTR